jgi:UDP-glucose 4-epimerase
VHILVSGGAGFIGSHLVELLLSEGHSVHVIDDLSTGQIDNIAAFRHHPQFRFDQADIVTWDSLVAAARPADRVYHLAAVVGVRRVLEDPIRVLATNIAGTERLLRAVAAGARKPRLLLASTSEVYGLNPSASLAEHHPLIHGAGNWSRSSYAVSKLAGEHFASAYARDSGLATIIVRIFNIIGPRQRGEYGMVLPNFVRQAVRGLPISVYGDGNQTRSFCDVRDAVRMMTQLVETSPSPGDVVNLGNDQEITINDLADLVRRRAGSPSQIRRQSYAEGYGEEFADAVRRRPDLTRLKALIGFTPCWTLTQTIDDLIAREHHPIHASSPSHSPAIESEVR